MPSPPVRYLLEVDSGLELTDEAFHPTVLVLWRNKLWASERSERIFEAVRTVVDESGVIAKKHRLALDSTAAPPKRNSAGKSAPS